MLPNLFKRGKGMLFFSVLFACSFTLQLAGAQTVVFSVDSQAQGNPLKHVWSFFGFDECNFAYSDGAKELMKTLAGTQKDPVYLRCHFLLNTGDGTPALKWGSTNAYTEDANGKPVYSWPIMDKIFDAKLKSGCLPLVEIGFMPKALSVKPEPYQHKYPPDMWAGWAFPPNDYNKWAELIRQWAKNSLEQYGDKTKSWLWELWNEPDIFYFHNSEGKQANFNDYAKLFDYTEMAFHEVMPNGVLGGPHTTSPTYSAPARFLRGFLQHCADGNNFATGKKGTRLDYIGFHSKGGTRIFEGHPRMDLGANLLNNQKGFQIVAEFEKYSNTPIIIGECDPEGLAALSSTVAPQNGYRNSSYYAAYEVAMMKHTLDLSDSIKVNLKGVLTWAFMFDGKQYFEGFRTLSTNGIHKPVLNGFKMLGKLEGNRIPLTSTGALGTEKIIKEKVRIAPDIDGMATASGKMVQVIMWNYHDDIVDAEPNQVRLEIKLPADISKADVTHYRIDKTHSNAYTRWVSMGSPQNPSVEQIADLKKAAELELLEPAKSYNVEKGILSLAFELPRHSVSLVEVRY